MGPSDSRAPLGKLEEVALRSLTPHPIYFVIHLFASLPLSICSVYFVPDTVLTNVASIKSYAPLGLSEHHHPENLLARPVQD